MYYAFAILGTMLLAVNLSSLPPHCNLPAGVLHCEPSSRSAITIRFHPNRALIQRPSLSRPILPTVGLLGDTSTTAPPPCAQIVLWLNDYGQIQRMLNLKINFLLINCIKNVKVTLIIEPEHVIDVESRSRFAGGHCC